MKIPAFADIGKQASELLYGSKTKEFQYDQKVTLNMKSVEGVIGTAKIVKAGDKVNSDLKLSYAHAVGKNLLTLESTPANKKVTATVENTVIEGFKVTLAAQAPDTAKNVKLTTAYSQPYLTSKASMILAQKPKVDLAVATGYNGFVLGGSALVSIVDSDENGAKLSNAKLAAAYLGKDFTITAHTDPKFKVVKGTYWQQLDAASNIAAEVQHDFDKTDNNVALTMGYSHVSYTGTMYKVKFGTDGAVHLHTESKVRPDTTVALSALLNARSLGEDPKLGIAVDHSP